MVRLRPLNKREQSAKDQVAWECIDEHTIVYKPSSHERFAQPSSFTFDKVFGPASYTENVYEDGVKNVAVSALMGINATILAYGQTSSGKTYTMRVITVKAVYDIYKHIVNTPERGFRIRISGLEIYNENVRDLLNSDSGRNLKLLDDLEKGTVVEKLVEETANDDQHLKSLISICEAQRQVGETALNDTSSRSHQIIRLVSYILKGVISQEYIRGSSTIKFSAQGRPLNISLSDPITIANTKFLKAENVAIRVQLSNSCVGWGEAPTLRPITAEDQPLALAKVTEVCDQVISDKQLIKHLQKKVARLEAARTPDPLSEKDYKIQQGEDHDKMPNN